MTNTNLNTIEQDLIFSNFSLLQEKYKQKGFDLYKAIILPATKASHSYFFIFYNNNCDYQIIYDFISVSQNSYYEEVNSSFIRSSKSTSEMFEEYHQNKCIEALDFIALLELKKDLELNLPKTNNNPLKI